jgi:hypothetical protein
MLDTIQRRQLTCSKCEQPMAWHSDQDVNTRYGYVLMRVFQCNACNRLKACRVISNERAIASA